MGHPAAAQLEHAARLRACGHDEVFAAIEGVEREMHAERGLGERDRDLADEIVPVAREPLVRTDAHVDVQVARRAAAGPDPAASGEPQRGAVVDARGDVDLVGALLDDAPLAATSRAGRCDDLARPTATRTWTSGDHLAEDRLPHPADLPAAVALVASDRLRPLGGARARTDFAHDRRAHGDGCLHAENRLLEIEIDHDPEIGATRRPGWAAASAAE